MSELQVRIRLDDDESLAAALEVAEANGASAETVAVEGGGGLEAQFAPVAAVLMGAEGELLEQALIRRQQAALLATRR